jgi:hypothetical protein
VTLRKRDKARAKQARGNLEERTALSCLGARDARANPPPGSAGRADSGRRGWWDWETGCRTPDKAGRIGRPHWHRFDSYRTPKSARGHGSRPRRANVRRDLERLSLQVSVVFGTLWHLRGGPRKRRPSSPQDWTLVGRPESDWGKIPPCPARRGWSMVRSSAWRLTRAGQRIVFTWWRRNLQQQQQRTAVNCNIDVDVFQVAHRQENHGWDGPKLPNPAVNKRGGGRHGQTEERW